MCGEFEVRQLALWGSTRPIDMQGKQRNWPEWKYAIWRSAGLTNHIKFLNLLHALPNDIEQAFNTCADPALLALIAITVGAEVTGTQLDEYAVHCVKNTPDPNDMPLCRLMDQPMDILIRANKHYDDAESGTVPFMVSWSPYPAMEYAAWAAWQLWDIGWARGKGHHAECKHFSSQYKHHAEIWQADEFRKMVVNS
jgi:hypothetical protein